MPVHLPPPVAHTAEDLLLDFERTGDPAPFAEIVRRYSGMVYGVCYRVTRNAHDAEDATQAAFLKLATQARTGNGVPRVGPWLQQVAKTTAVDLRRSRGRRQNREQARAAIEVQQQGYDDPTDTAGMDELKELLREEVDRLPVHYRTPLILYYFGGLSTEQIAVELKTNAKALAVRLFRGRKMLGARLTDRGIVTAGGALVTLAVADAILGTLANAVWTVPGSGAAGGVAAGGLAAGGMSAGGAGWSAGAFKAGSGWATSHSALCASIADRVVSVTRAAAVGALAGKWKVSILVAVSAATALAGSSEAVRASAVVQAVGGIIQDLGAAIRGIGRGPGMIRQNLPALRAEAPPPAPAAAEPSPAAPPPVLAIVPVGQGQPAGPVVPSSPLVLPLPLAPPAGSSAAASVVATIRPYGFGNGPAAPAAAHEAPRVVAAPAGETDRRAQKATEAVLAFASGSDSTGDASPVREPSFGGGSGGSVAARRVAPIATRFISGAVGLPLAEIPAHLRPAIIAATYGANPPQAVLDLLASLPTPAASGGASGTGEAAGIGGASGGGDAMATGIAAAAGGAAATGEVVASLARSYEPQPALGPRPDGTTVAPEAYAMGAPNGSEALPAGSSETASSARAHYFRLDRINATSAITADGAFGELRFNSDPSPQFVTPPSAVPASQPTPAAGTLQVPEPTAFGTTAVGLLYLLGRRRRRYTP
jgi:RNA polymerase sigma factor (sigma-70 family)